MMKAVMQGALAAAVLVVVLVSPSFAEKAGIGWKETIAAKSGQGEDHCRAGEDVRLQLLHRVP